MGSISPASRQRSSFSMEDGSLAPGPSSDSLGRPDIMDSPDGNLDGKSMSALALIMGELTLILACRPTRPHLEVL